MALWLQLVLQLNIMDGVTRTASQINSARDGTVTSVATGSGLTGGTITGSGTVSMANSWITNSVCLARYRNNRYLQNSLQDIQYLYLVDQQAVVHGTFTFTITNGVVERHLICKMVIVVHMMTIFHSATKWSKYSRGF